MRLPRLYASWWCPFANRATLACHLKGLENGVHYEYRETMPYKRETEFLEVSPKALIPAIRMADDRGFCESLVVVEFIDEYFNGPKLLRGDAVTRAQLRQYADHASKSIFPNAFKVIAMQTESEREEGVQALADGLTGIVAKMGSTSPFFEGETPGYMECVLTPHCHHLHLLKAFRNVDISDLLGGEELKRFESWFSATMSHPRVIPVLADKARLEKAYRIYTTGEGPAQALKAIKKGDQPP